MTTKKEEVSNVKEVSVKKLDGKKIDDKKEKDKSKKNTSLRLDKKTLKELKILAIEKETSVQKLIESLVKDYIDSHRS